MTRRCASVVDLEPAVYLGVKPVTLDEAGEVIDHVVEMVHLLLHQMMDRQLDRGEIDIRPSTIWRSCSQVFAETRTEGLP